MQDILIIEQSQNVRDVEKNSSMRRIDYIT